MSRDPRALLWDALDAARAVAGFLEGQTEAGYLADPLRRAAVERKCEVIGEAPGRLARTAPELAARIPELPRVVAFRNLLIHGYAVVDDVLVWRTATRELPALRDRLQALLDEG